MTAFMDIGSSTPMLATMIGLAVGIDYALFILARYRSELEHTDDREEAVGVAVGTAGSAVVFAGLTVLIALSALAVVRIPFLTAMGLAAAATVLIAVLVALTLLPAVLGMTKSKAFGGRSARTARSATSRASILNNGVRWARLVGRRPVAVVILVVVGLGALAHPARRTCTWPSRPTAPPRPTPPSARPPTSSPRPSARAARRRCWSSSTRRDVPPSAQRGAAFGEVAAWAADQDGVANAQIVAHERGRHRRPGPGHARQPGPTTPRTEDLLDDLRPATARPASRTETGTDIGVTGLTAITTDVSERLSDALPIYLAVVIGLAFLLLMLVFRSILVPLTATLGFLLSVLATLGATVAVFQEGAFGLMEGQPIVSFMPIFLIGVVFGLAMDYQVFLVTRIREAHVHGASPAEAVVDGFRNSARVVAAAAVIMTVGVRRVHAP